MDLLINLLSVSAVMSWHDELVLFVKKNYLNRINVGEVVKAVNCYKEFIWTELYHDWFYLASAIFG